MKIKIPVVMRLEDGMDGTWTVNIYNSEEEMLADHPLARKSKLTDKQKEEILSGEDEYENGYINKGSIELELENGAVRLASKMRINVGQQ